MNNYIKKILSIILILIMIGCLIVIGKEFFESEEQLQSVKSVQEIIKKNMTINQQQKFNKDAFKELKEKNDNFVAYLIVDDIIEQAIVKGKDNDRYLNYTFNEKYVYQGGNPFMDYRNTLSDANITMYGHSHAWRHEVAFSHLNDIILDQNYYENHSKIELYTENDVREYVICYAYYITEEIYQEYDFTQTTFFDEEDFNSYINFPKLNTRINSINGNIEYGDNILTLQCCKRGDPDTKVIIVAKEIGRKEY